MIHVHACHTGDMRTTIEMKREHRVADEALELSIKTQNARKSAIRKALAQKTLALKCSMSGADEAGLRTRTEEIRANWR
jgi:hypothetical protein